MHINENDIHFLKELLGIEGSVAGLEYSRLTSNELLHTAKEFKCSVDQKMRRRDIAIELINSNEIRIEKTDSELLNMHSSEIKRYLKDRLASRSEITKRLQNLGITVGSDARKNLVDFAAREISDMGMYERVAKGKNGQS